MKLLFGTLLGFFVTSFSAQDLSSYTYIDGTESLKESAQKKFEITQIDDYFYVTNNENEEQIIASSDHHLYKFDQSGNLIDTLELSARVEFGMYNIQPENYFIYSEDGYFPNWIKTGDKTKHQYNNTVNVYKDVYTIDPDAVKQLKKIVLDAAEQYEKGVYNSAESKDLDKLRKECDDYLDERSELRKLFKTLKQQAKYFYRYLSSRYVFYAFMINNEVIRVEGYSDIILNDNSDKITGGEEILEIVIPEFQEEQKSFHFEETKTSDSYWKGTAYFDLPIGESTLKVKVNSSRYLDRIEINRNVFPGNRKFVLIEIVGGYYFIKEK